MSRLSNFCRNMHKFATLQEYFVLNKKFVTRAYKFILGLIGTCLQILALVSYKVYFMYYNKKVFTSLCQDLSVFAEARKSLLHIQFTSYTIKSIFEFMPGLTGACRNFKNLLQSKSTLYYI